MRNGLWRKELSFTVIGLFLAMSVNLPVHGNEIMDNHPPENPYFIGLVGGYEGEPSYIEFNTTDHDGDDVYYLIQWDALTVSGWFGPYKSGEIVRVNYTWENMGEYIIKILAKDIYEAKSNWSWIHIRIGPHLEARIQDGFGVGATVTIKNLGVRDYENIPWNFILNRPKYFSYHQYVTIKEKQGTIKSLKIGEERTIRIGVIFRFTLRGEVGFYLEFEQLPGISCNDSCRCIIIGPFVYTFR